MLFPAAPAPASPHRPHDRRRPWTNTEAAARLILSNKAIDAHLHRTYRKLRIHSRKELTHVLPRHRETADFSPNVEHSVGGVPETPPLVLARVVSGR